MLFSSHAFVLGFFPAVVLAWHLDLIHRSPRTQVAFLLLASLFFYGWWDIRLIPLLLASITFNFLIGRQLARPDGPTLLLPIGIASNLLLLIFFKYCNFLTANLQALGLTLPQLNILLPLGISFFTFEQIAYLVDVRRSGQAEHDPLRYALFVAFFPRLVAGPILRATEFLPQLTAEESRRSPGADLAVGLTIFSIGLFKKTVVADGIAIYAKPIFDQAAQGSAPDFLMAWIGVLAYSLQIYFDFSGYSDMAIGIARCFGIRFPMNFYSPYKATGIIEFWRRWHMTLSRFLRDYLYISLGGNRRGQARRFVNLFATMLLGGLWHGANWTFVAWGALHGLYLAANHAWLALIPQKPASVLRTALAWIATFGAVLIAWVFFRSRTLHAAFVMLASLAGLNGIRIPSGLAAALGPMQAWAHRLGVTFDGGGSTFVVSGFAWVSLLIAAVLVLPNTIDLLARWSPTLEDFPGRPTFRLAWSPTLRWAAATAALAVLGIFGITRGSEFLYWQF